MAIKDQVQGVVQALFGAYAGGYLAELTAEATGGSVGATAARLASIQGVILGKDMKANGDFVDTILGNLGVSTISAAYSAAAKWANDALTAGASRADVVVAAVTFLEGVAAGTVADPAYTAIAKAYTAKVAAGIAYSESTTGAAVLSLQALQTQANIATAFNLSKTLASLSAADKAVSDYVDAWGLAQTPVIKAADSTAAQIYAKVETAEAAVETASAAPILSIAVATQGELNTTETAGATTYKAADATENLALSVAQSQIATAKIALDGTLANASAALEAISTTDVTGTVQGLVDAQLAAVTAADAATTAAAAATVALNGKVAEADVLLDAAFDATGKNFTFAITVTGDTVTFDGNNATAANDFDSYEATYDAVANTWSFTKDTGTTVTTLSDAAVAADTNLQKLLANATSKGVLDAVAANSEAAAAVTAANAVITAKLAAVEAADGTLTNGTALTGTALIYATAKSDLTSYATKKAAFDKAVTAQEAARAEAAGLATLEKASAALSTALVDANWNVATLGTAAGVTVDADADARANDAFVFNSKTSTNNTAITHFGAAGTDVISFEAGAFTVVKMAAGKTLADITGSSTTKEIFVVEQAGDTILYVEQNAFDGNVSTHADLVAITLTGLTGKTMSLTDTGFTIFA